MQETFSSTTYGLIGRPLGHSQSKAFFTRYFAETGATDESYDNFELPALTPQTLYALMLMNPRLRGFNVTAPYKLEIMQFLDSLTPEAEAVGAVNTVRIRRDTTGRVTALEGHNTDVEGFRESVRPMAERLNPGRGALILGTGGASKGVAEALRQLSVDYIKVSRTPADGQISYADITSDVLARYPLIINATPLGTYPAVDTCPPIPYTLLDSSIMCHDLVYNPAETAFMRRAAAHGAGVKNGLEMLHGQAMASLRFWRNLKMR